MCSALASTVAVFVNVLAPEVAATQRMLACELQRKHGAGEFDTLAVALYLRACLGQMAAERVVRVIVIGA